jgi:lysophospholipase L1-like esterase
MPRPIALLVLLATAAGCGHGRCAEVGALPAGSVFAVGDSVLAWNKDSCQSVADHVGLARGERVEVSAISGAQLTGSAPIADQVPPGSWDWAIVDGGANDLNQRCDCGDCAMTLDQLATVDGASGAMPDLVDGLLAQGTAVVIAGPYALDEGAWYGFDRCHDALLALRDRYLAVAESRSEVAYADLAAAVYPPQQPELLWIDQVHPNPDGAALLGQLIADAMDPP